MTFNKIILASISLALVSLASAGAPSAKAKASHLFSIAQGRLAASKQTAVFIENGGQWDSQARYLMQGKGVNLWLTSEGARYQFPIAPKQARWPQSIAIGMSFAGGSPLHLNSLHQLSGVVNYFNYGKRKVNLTGLHRYADVEAKNVYPGIDVQFCSTSHQPRYNLVVNPGADPAKIALKFDGVRSMSRRADGVVEMQTPAGTLRHKGLFVYQGLGKARKSINCVVQTVGTTLHFKPGSYDRSKPLIIDPIIEGTYFGTGSETLTQGTQDSYGDVVLGGNTSSTDFPTTLGLSNGGTNGAITGFVSVLTPDLASLIYSSYIGSGYYSDSANYSSSVEALSADSAGNVLLIQSERLSYGFDPPGNLDYYLKKLDAAGNLSSVATVLSLTNNDSASVYPDSQFHLAVAPNGDIGIAANLQEYADIGPKDPTFIRVSGSTGAMTTYAIPIFVNDATTLQAITSDKLSNFYLAGTTSDQLFPVTSGSFQTQFYGLSKAFVALMKTDSSGFQSATFLGGNLNNEVHALKIDLQGNIACAGLTSSIDFPCTSSAISSTLAGPSDAFVARLTPDLKSLVSSTLLGGSGFDNPHYLQIDANNFAWIAGTSDSANFPVTAQAEAVSVGNSFVSSINPTGTVLKYSTRWYGDSLGGFQIDPVGSILVQGTVKNAGYVPVTANALQTSAPGPASLFVSRFSAASQPAPAIAGVAAAPVNILGGLVGNGYVYLKSAAPDGGVLVTLQSSNPSVASVSSSIIIPGGQTFGTFKINTAAVTKVTPATITASAGLSKASGTLQVENYGLKIYFNPDDTTYPENSEVIGGVDTYVSVSSRVSTAVTVTLSASGKAAMPPQTITIPKGSYYLVVRIPTTGVAASASLTLVAQIGSERAVATLKLDPASLVGLTFKPSTLVGGAASVGRLNLDGNAPSSGALVPLSSDTANIVVPTSVKIPPFASTVAFPVSTKGVSASVTGHVKATLKTKTISTALVVNPATLKSVTLDHATVRGGDSVIATVKLTGFAGPAGYTVTTSSSSSVAVVPASVKVLGGTSLFSFRVNTKAVTKTTNVTITAKVGTLVFTAPLALTP